MRNAPAARRCWNWLEMLYVSPCSTRIEFTSRDVNPAPQIVFATWSAYQSGWLRGTDGHIMRICVCVASGLLMTRSERPLSAAAGPYGSAVGAGPAGFH